MKAAREALGLTQTVFHEQYGYGSVRSYQKNEAGANEAGICLAASFIAAGINANWLLTGEGPMLLAELQASAAVGFDLARFRLAIEATEEGLAAAGRVMAPDKKAELVLAIYDMFDEPAVTKERVLKLIKLAA
jgi:hypothetical protein